MPANQGNILGGSQSYAIEKPAPVQLNATMAQRTAAMGAKPSEIRYTEASTNNREVQQALENVSQKNLRAMSAVSGLVQGVLKDVQEKQFADGYLRHMQGESVASIAKDKPFFGLFGDGGAVRGARTRQAENAGASLMSYVQQNQGDLIRMTADEQRVVLADYVQNLKTGDDEADQLIGAGAIKMFPSIIDNLTRASEAEQQRQAAVSQADTIKTHADALKYATGQVATGQLAPEHLDYLKANFLEASRPLPGQSPESYRAAMTGNVLSLTKDGNFEMANLIREKALDGMMTPEEQRQMDSQQKQANAEWLKDNPSSGDYTQFSAQLPVQIAAGRYMSEEDVYADVDRVNNDYMIETGSTKPLIDNQKKAEAGAAFIQYQTRQQAANDKAAQAAQDDFAKRGLYSEGFAKGMPSQMAASGLDARQKAALEQNEATKFMTEQGNTSAVTVGRLAVNGHVVAPLKEQLSGTLGVLKGGGIPKEEDLVRLPLAYQKFMNTPYGAGAALAYFGDDLPLVQTMANMDMSKKENQQYIREQAQAAYQPVKPSQEVLKEAAELVNSEMQPGWWNRTFGDSQSMGAGFETMMKEQMQGATATLMAQYPNMPQDQILKMAATKVNERTDIAGNFVITGSKKGEVFKELNSHLNVKMATPSDTRINTIFNEGIKSVVGQDDFKVGSLQALPNGRVLATVVLANGQQSTVPLMLSDLAAKANAAKVKKVADTKALRQSSKLETGMREAYKANEQRRQF